MIKFALKRIALGVTIMLGSTVLIYALLLAAQADPSRNMRSTRSTPPRRKRGTSSLSGSISQCRSSTAAGSAPAAVTPMVSTPS